MTTAELTVVEPTEIERPRPSDVIAEATEQAEALQKVIESQQLFSTISGRRYVQVEGWTTCLALRGIMARQVGHPIKLDGGGYLGEAELVRISDGMVLGRATGICGTEGDGHWPGRPAYAQASMAVTRATGKAARLAFSWVMTLAGFEATPAEEMDSVVPQTVQPKAAAPAAEQPDLDGVPAYPFKKHQGQPICDVPKADLEWMIGAMIEGLDKPGKENYRDTNVAYLKSVRDWLVQQDDIYAPLVDLYAKQIAAL